LTEAGLQDYVEIREGDAMKTLEGHDTEIDFLFLDGWKDLYIPLFELLEPQFHSDTLIYADNIDMARQFANHVLSKRNKYTTRYLYSGKAMLIQIR